MLPHSLVRAVAALAPGKRVRVLAAGDAYELPLKPAPARIEPPHPMEAVSKQLLERDAETRATVAAVADVVARMGETAQAVQAAVADVASGQAQVARSVSEIADTMALPTKPIYDAAGKLIGAQRVRKLGA